MSCEHDLDHTLCVCRRCKRTFEQIRRGELAHPGLPTLDRIWAFVFETIRKARTA